jgi:hypothetical protein
VYVRWDMYYGIGFDVVRVEVVMGGIGWYSGQN